MKRKLLALVLLVALGFAKLPVENHVTQALRSQHLLSVPVDLNVRENLGQMSFAAALGGLRSLVASITYLQAYSAWQNINWGKVDSLFQLTTRLQPQFANYWDEAAWQMSYNAASSYLNDTTLNSAVRGKLYHDHVQRGIDILQQGLRYLPDNPKLWSTLAEIYERRVRDPQKAAVAYLQVFRITKQPRYLRNAGYQLAQATDEASWQKAYEYLSQCYKNGQRYPSLITILKSLEERLHTPPEKRIPDALPQTPASATDSGPRR